MLSLRPNKIQIVVLHLLIVVSSRAKASRRPIRTILGFPAQVTKLATISLTSLTPFDIMTITSLTLLTLLLPLEDVNRETESPNRNIPECSDDRSSTEPNNSSGYNSNENPSHVSNENLDQITNFSFKKFQRPVSEKIKVHPLTLISNFWDRHRAQFLEKSKMLKWHMPYEGKYATLNKSICHFWNRHRTPFPVKIQSTKIYTNDATLRSGFLFGKRAR